MVPHGKPCAPVGLSCAVPPVPRDSADPRESCGPGPGRAGLYLQNCFPLRLFHPWAVLVCGVPFTENDCTTHSDPHTDIATHVVLLLKWSLSVVSWLFATPQTETCQTHPSMGFSGQEYWSGLPLPSPGELPDAGIEPRFPTLQADSSLSELGNPPCMLF